MACNLSRCGVSSFVADQPGDELRRVGLHGPSSPGTVPRHGRRFTCSDPKTWPEPDARLVADGRRYGTVTVDAWHGMHRKLSTRGHWTEYQVPPIVKGSVIRVEVEHLPKPTTRVKKTLWLWWSSEGVPDLVLC
jgi:hypothetical protein